jgi:DHA3 family macrolide efflux protein-like MFS transporter
MESAYGIGVIAGGLLLGVWGGFRRRILTTMLGLAIAGLTILLLGLLPAGQLGAALGIILVCGVALALTDGPLFAVLQSTIAPEMQGRVLMLFASLVTLTSPIGLVAAGRSRTRSESRCGTSPPGRCASPPGSPVSSSPP